MYGLLILLISSFVYSQHPKSGVVEYTIETIENVNSLAVTKATKDLSEQKKLLEIFSNEPAHFILQFNGSEAIYKSTNITMESDANKKSTAKFLEVYGGGTSLYYTNSAEKTTLTQKSSFGELFLISGKVKDWELTRESKKIGNYTCYKAIRNAKSSNDAIWYTPEIPAQFGPIVYVGLPGLVLEVIAGKIRITATKIILQNEPIIVMKPEKGTKITEEEYMKILEKTAAEMGF